ncbi:MAG: co-chaperone GroES [Patescibacteria group bacterium]
MLQPLSNHVLIELIEEDNAKTTKSGIVLPDTAEKKKQSKGTIIAIGPGKLSDDGNRLPMSVKIGDKILFKEPWSDDNKMEDGEKKLFLVEEDDILGIIN